MKVDDLKEATVNIKVIDSRFLKQVILGSYEMDLSTIYFEENHEYFQTWLTLTDPTYTRYNRFKFRDGVMGYLLMNICLLGPNDEPVVHTLEQQKKDNSSKEKALCPAKI